MQKSMTRPRTYMDMYHEAEEVANEKYDDTTQEVLWVQARDSHLGALCMIEIDKLKNNF